MLAKKKKSCKEKIIILNTCVLILIFQWGFYNFLGIYFFFLSCILAYLLSCLYLCLFILFVFYAHVFWVSFALLLLLLLFPTFVAAYPFALSCFVLCALLVSPSPKSIPLHNFGTHHSHHSLFSLSLSLSLSLYFCFFFFFFFRSLFFYVSFCGKILAKFCFANFDRNPKRKGKKNKTKQNEVVQEKEYVCCFLLMLFLILIFFWVEIFSARKNGYYSISLVSQNFLRKIAIPNRLMIIVSCRFW